MEFHLVDTSSVSIAFKFRLTSFAHLLKVANLLGEVLTNLHATLILLIEESISFNPSHTIKFKMCETPHMHELSIHQSMTISNTKTPT